jgi:type I restriction enzyme M protein
VDIIGNAYEYLIGRFASGAGKKAGEFYTPPEVSHLLAKLLDPPIAKTRVDAAVAHRAGAGADRSFLVVF